jgi:hypothetical protein
MLKAMPKVKKKITTFGQVAFIAFAAIVDGIEILFDLLPLFGIIANRIVDIVVAGIFFVYAMAKGLTITEDAKVYISIAGTVAGEFLPGFDIAPFFTIDAWYITRSIKAKDKAKQRVMNKKENESVIAEQNRQDWITKYQERQAMEQAVKTQEKNEQEEDQI